MPLVYPFIVNDPGEGVQAKRRAHAVIVDHLVPPMMRAETYDELAELEALLDEYARLEILDPPKLPGLAVQIWDAIERANLQTDLGVAERPDDLGLLVEHIDGYLCEVKDIQVKDGLHVLGVPPAGPQLRGLVSAMLRLDPSDDVRGPAQHAWPRRWSSTRRRSPRPTGPTGCTTCRWRCSTRSPRASGRRRRRATRASRCSAAPTPTSPARCASPARSSSRASRRRPTS